MITKFRTTAQSLTKYRYLSRELKQRSHKLKGHSLERMRQAIANGLVPLIDIKAGKTPEELCSVYGRRRGQNTTLMQGETATKD
jgi:hypothetical protein